MAVNHFWHSFKMDLARDLFQKVELKPTAVEAVSVWRFPRGCPVDIPQPGKKHPPTFVY